MSETIALLMIVRDEAKVIERAIQSILPIIDEYLICDTGPSMDGTQQLIEGKMGQHQMRGRVIFKEWQNYGFNRSYLMEQAYNTVKTDFFILIDADEILVKANFQPFDEKDKVNLLSFTRKHPEVSLFPMKTFYDIKGQDPVEYPRHQLIRNNQLYKWILPYHEKLTPTVSSTMVFYPGIINHTRREGYSSQNPQNSEKHIQAYFVWLETYPNDPRVIYYLGQTYRDVRNWSESIKWYENRLELEGKGDIQEIFVSLISLGRLYSYLGDYFRAKERFLIGIQKFPHRLELYYELMVLLSDKFKNYQEAFDISKLAPTSLPDSLDALVEPMIYKWKFQYKKAALTWYIDEKEMGRKLILELLEEDRVPEEHRDFVSTQYFQYFS